MADLEAVDELADELQALRDRLAAVEQALGGSAGLGRHPPSLPDLVHRLATLERRAGIVPGLDPLPDFGRPGRGRPATAVTRTLAWHERLPAAGAVAVLAALLLWLVHPSLPAGRVHEAAPVPTPLSVAPTAPAWQPAFSQDDHVPGPLDFREDHRQSATTPAPLPALLPSNVLCADAC